ncbi:hypothetical protein QM012_003062 [Aureobasidium pullulans]|uniref:Rhodopsin domain-containing protein n=1 Tax=Aureobasidium pullulans TaxID=5580 RepID=A0ABR0T967_AURPU
MSDHSVLSRDSLPPDVYYFAQLTPTNHSGIVYVVCIVSLTYALLCSSIRFVLRRGMYSFDDAALLVSTLACVVQHTFVFVALHNGMGNSSYVLQPGQQEILNKSSYTRLVLFFVVNYLAKISLTLFTRRLFYGQERFNRIICDIILVISLIFLLASILLISIDCHAGWYFKTKALCPNLQSRWVTIKTLDVLSELAIVIVPIMLICRILLNPKHKAVIIGTFAARLPVIAFTLLHLYYLDQSLNNTHDRGIAIVQPVVWLQITLLWSMVTASLPSFRPLVSPFDTVMEESPTHPTPGSNGAVFIMGTDQEKAGKSASILPVSNSSRLSQLEPVVSAGSQQGTFRGYNETIVEGPKKKLFRTPSKKEDDIELGNIQHITKVEVTYEEATKPSRWSKIWRESASTMAEDMSVPVSTGTRSEEAPPSRRRSTYAFIDEANIYDEIQRDFDRDPRI